MSNDSFKERYGPWALVTGASSGIGRAFAERLAGKGVNVVLLARRAQRLDELDARLRQQHGVEANICVTDLAVSDAARRILDTTDGLDIGLLVSNAGFGLKGEHAGNDPKAMADMLMVNCQAPMLLTHGFIPRLRRRGRGGIILTSSVEGLIGCPYSTVYSATKAFVNSLGEGLWAELAPDDIQVLTICPGATDTEAAALQGIDLRKLQNVMMPEEVVDLALAHLGDGPTCITSEHYRAQFEPLLALPRRSALMAMARSMKPQKS